MKNLKIFETPSITFLCMNIKDVITFSEPPEVVFDDQLDVWDVYND